MRREKWLRRFRKPRDGHTRAAAVATPEQLERRLALTASPVETVPITLAESAIGLPVYDSPVWIRAETVPTGTADVGETTSITITAVVDSLPEDTPTSSRIKVADIVVAGVSTSTLTLSGERRGDFEIVGSALYLKADTSLNYAADRDMQVTVGLSGTGVSADYTLTISDDDRFQHWRGRDVVTALEAKTAIYDGIPSLNITSEWTRYTYHSRVVDSSKGAVTVLDSTYGGLIGMSNYGAHGRVATMGSNTVFETYFKYDPLTNEHGRLAFNTMSWLSGESRTIGQADVLRVLSDTYIQTFGIKNHNNHSLFLEGMKSTIAYAADDPRSVNSLYDVLTKDGAWNVDYDVIIVRASATQPVIDLIKGWMDATGGGVMFNFSGYSQSTATSNFLASVGLAVGASQTPIYGDYKPSFIDPFSVHGVYAQIAPTGNGDGRSAATPIFTKENVALPTHIAAGRVSWTSSNPERLAADGTRTGVGDATLTAHVTFDDGTSNAFPVYYRAYTPVANTGLELRAIDLTGQSSWYTSAYVNGEFMSKTPLYTGTATSLEWHTSSYVEPAEVIDPTAPSKMRKSLWMWSGYLMPTLSGDHQFLVQGDFDARFYIEANGAVQSQSATWFHYATRTLTVAGLEAGKSYRIWAYEIPDELTLSGGDNMSIQWKKPGDSVFGVIPATAFARFPEGMVPSNAGYPLDLLPFVSQPASPSGSLSTTQILTPAALERIATAQNMGNTAPVANNHDLNFKREDLNFRPEYLALTDATAALAKTLSIELTAASSADTIKILNELLPAVASGATLAAAIESSINGKLTTDAAVTVRYNAGLLTLTDAGGRSISNFVLGKTGTMVNGPAYDRLIKMENDSTSTVNGTTTATLGALSGVVHATDIDGDTITYSILDGPLFGTATIDAATGRYLYQPSAAGTFRGYDQFHVLASDGRGGVSKPIAVMISEMASPIVAIPGIRTFTAADPVYAEPTFKGVAKPGDFVLEEVFLAQTHVFRAEDPYRTFTEGRWALIKVNATSASSADAPDLMAVVTDASGAELGSVRLTGPAKLPTAVDLPSTTNLGTHSNSDSYTGPIKGAWMKQGITITVKAAGETVDTSFANVMMGGDREVDLYSWNTALFDLNVANYVAGPINYGQELLDRIPVGSLKLYAYPSVAIDGMAGSTGDKSLTPGSDSSYDWTADAGFNWAGVFIKANTGAVGGVAWGGYNGSADTGGLGGGSYPVAGAPTSPGYFIHEVGHAMGAGHSFGDGYPYVSYSKSPDAITSIEGIPTSLPAGGTDAWVGPTWGYDQTTGKYLPNYYTDWDGSTKLTRDTMAYGRPQPSDRTFTMFSDVSVYDVQDRFNRSRQQLDWQPNAVAGQDTEDGGFAGEGYFRKWNQTTNAWDVVTNGYNPSNAIEAEFPHVKDTPVYFVKAVIVNSTFGQVTPGGDYRNDIDITAIRTIGNLKEPFHDILTGAGRASRPQSTNYVLRVTYATDQGLLTENLEIPVSYLAEYGMTIADKGELVRMEIVEAAKASVTDYLKNKVIGNYRYINSEALANTVFGSDGFFKVTDTNITLPRYWHGGEVTWSATVAGLVDFSTGRIDHTKLGAGSAVRAQWVENGVYKDQRFVLALPDQDVVSLQLFGSKTHAKGYLTENMSLPTQFVGSTVEWSSSNPGVLDASGVIQAGGDVTLTARVTYANGAVQTFSREYAVIDTANTGGLTLRVIDTSDDANQPSDNQYKSAMLNALLQTGAMTTKSPLYSGVWSDIWWDRKTESFAEFNLNGDTSFRDNVMVNGASATAAYNQPMKETLWSMSGFLKPSETGAHSLGVQADDTMKVFVEVDGAIVSAESNYWASSTSTMNLVAGKLYPITIFFKTTQPDPQYDFLRLSWKTPSVTTAGVHIPAANLVPMPLDATAPYPDNWLPSSLRRTTDTLQFTDITLDGSPTFLPLSNEPATALPPGSIAQETAITTPLVAGTAVSESFMVDARLADPRMKHWVALGLKAADGTVTWTDPLETWEVSVRGTTMTVTGSIDKTPYIDVVGIRVFSDDNWADSTAAATLTIHANEAALDHIIAGRESRYVIDYGSDGADAIDLSSLTAKAAALYGGDGNDTLTGSALDDVIMGGLGDDILITQGGGDELFGGLGNDVFRFDAALLSNPYSRRTLIGDFDPAHDTIDLSLLIARLQVELSAADFAGLEVVNTSASGATMVLLRSGTTTYAEIELNSDPPPAPLSLSATPGDRSVQLGWSAPAADGGAAINDYLIEYSSDSGSTWTTFNDGTSPATSATVTGLTNGTGYIFRVAAKNSAGEGRFSISTSTITPTAIIPPALRTELEIDSTMLVSSGLGAAGGTAAGDAVNAVDGVVGLNQGVVVYDVLTSAPFEEQRWAGGDVYTNNTWDSVTPVYNGTLPELVTAQNVGDSYSRRIRGAVTAPVTGEYRFYLASDDDARLYLSTTDSAAGKQQIAIVSGSTNFQQWDKYSSQASAAITLQAGQRYYIEVQHKEVNNGDQTSNGDHASVGWVGPGISAITPIAVRSALYVADGTTGAVQLATRGFASATTPSGAATTFGGISSDGRHVVFGSSDVTAFGNDGTAFTDANATTSSPASDLFVFDRTTGTVRLVTAGDTATSSRSRQAQFVGVSADSQYVVYTTDYVETIAGFSSPAKTDLLMTWSLLPGGYPTTAGKTRTTSVRVADIDPTAMRIELSGGWIASNVVATVSSGSGITRGTGTVSFWAQYLDGTYTKAVKLELQDVATGILVKATAAKYVSGNQPNYNWNAGGTSASVATSLTASGYGVSLLEFRAAAVTDTMKADGLASKDVVAFNLATGEQRLLSHSAASAGTQSQMANVGGVTLSTDGRFVLFTAADATTLGNAGTAFTDSAPAVTDLFAADIRTGEIRLLSHSAATATASAGAAVSLVGTSADGGYAVFSSADASAFGFTDSATGAADLFAVSLTDGSIRLITRAASGATTTSAGVAVIVEKIAGSHVYFTANDATAFGFASDGDTSKASLFRYDLSSGSLILLSHATSSQSQAVSGDVKAGSVTVSPDGRYVAFAVGLPGDTGGFTVSITGEALFLADTQTGAIRMLNATNTGGTTLSYGAWGSVSTKPRFFTPDSKALLWQVQYISYVATDRTGGGSGGTNGLLLTDLSGGVPAAGTSMVSKILSHTAASPTELGPSVTLLGVSEDSRLAFFSAADATPFGNDGVAFTDSAPSATDIFAVDLASRKIELVSGQALASFGQTATFRGTGEGGSVIFSLGNVAGIETVAGSLTDGNGIGTDLLSRRFNLIDLASDDDTSVTGTRFDNVTLRSSFALHTLTTRGMSVQLLDNGSLVEQRTAGSDGRIVWQLSGVAPGQHTYTLRETTEQIPLLLAGAAGASSLTVTVVDVTPPTATIGEFTGGDDAVSSAAIRFSEAVTGLGVSDFTLTHAGEPVSLAGATLTGSGDSYTLGNLVGATATYGGYVLTLVAAGSGVTDAAGNPLAADASATWQSHSVASGQTTTDTVARSGTAQIVKRGSGDLVLDRTNSHSGGTVLEAGRIIVRNLAALGTGTLEIRAGATLLLDLPSGQRLTGLTGMTIATGIGGGRLDLGRNGIVLPAGSFDPVALRAQLVTGRNGGQWNGIGIGSSAATSGSNRAVGYRVLSNGQAVVAWAAYGDGNLDGQVNFTDISLLVGGGRYLAGAGASWVQGDVNYNGSVTFSDISLIVNAGLFGVGPYGTLGGTATAVGTMTTALTGSGLLEQTTAASDDTGLEIDLRALAFASLVDDPLMAMPKKRRTDPFGL